MHIFLPVCLQCNVIIMLPTHYNISIQAKDNEPTYPLHDFYLLKNKKNAQSSLSHYLQREHIHILTYIFNRKQ